MDELVALVATAAHQGLAAADAMAAAKQTLRDLVVREKAAVDESEVCSSRPQSPWHIFFLLSQRTVLEPCSS